MVELSYTRHALRRMARRRITEAMIEGALTNPDWRVPTLRNSRYDARVGDRRLVVIVALEHSPPVVVTVWWEGEDDD